MCVAATMRDWDYLGDVRYMSPVILVSIMI